MIEIQDREVNQAFARLLAAGTNPQPWLAAVGNAVADNTRLRFGAGVSPAGVPWHPLSLVTAARRRAGNGGQPLLDTGRLRNSIGSQVQGNSVVIGTNVKYGAFQQFGAKRGQFGHGRFRTRKGSFPIPWGDVPGRPYLGISSGDRAEISAILAAQITGEK